MTKTLPYWEKARATVAEEFDKKHLDGLLKDLSNIRKINVLLNNYSYSDNHSKIIQLFCKITYDDYSIEIINSVY